MPSSFTIPQPDLVPVNGFDSNLLPKQAPIPIPDSLKLRLPEPYVPSAFNPSLPTRLEGNKNILETYRLLGNDGMLTITPEVEARLRNVAQAKEIAAAMKYNKHEPSITPTNSATANSLPYMQEDIKAPDQTALVGDTSGNSLLSQNPLTEDDSTGDGGGPGMRLKELLMSEGAGTAIRGVGGAGVGYLLGKLLGDHGKLGAFLGGTAGLTPEIIKYAPKALEAIKGLFSKKAAANAVALDSLMEKQAFLGDNPLLTVAALRAASNMRDMGHRNVDLNAINVPQGALPPEELLLPEVRREGTKAKLKTIAKHLGIGGLSGAGLGALLGVIGGDSSDGLSASDRAIAGAMMGGILGTGAGTLTSAWAAPDAKLEAMKKKHAEINGWS